MKSKPDAVFNTITADDWKRQLAAARGAPNVACEQIRAELERQRRRLR